MIQLLGENFRHYIRFEPFRFKTTTVNFSTEGIFLGLEIFENNSDTKTKINRTLCHLIINNIKLVLKI